MNHLVVIYTSLWPPCIHFYHICVMKCVVHVCICNTHTETCLLFTRDGNNCPICSSVCMRACMQLCLCKRSKEREREETFTLTCTLVLGNESKRERDKEGMTISVINCVIIHVHICNAHTHLCYIVLVKMRRYIKDWGREWECMPYIISHDTLPWAPTLWETAKGYTIKYQSIHSFIGSFYYFMLH